MNLCRKREREKKKEKKGKKERLNKIPVVDQLCQNVFLRRNRVMMMLGPLLLLNKYIMSLISLHNNNKENSYG